MNPSVYESREKPVKVKARYYTKDLQDWANFYKIKIGSPTVFPVNSVKAMRGAFVAHEHEKISSYSRRVFEAYWGDNRDISQDDVLRDIARGVGLDEKEYFEKINSQPYKDMLRKNVEDLDRAGRLRFANHLRRGLDVLRQRSVAAGGVGARQVGAEITTEARRHKGRMENVAASLLLLFSVSPCLCGNSSSG